MQQAVYQVQGMHITLFYVCITTVQTCKAVKPVLHTVCNANHKHLEHMYCRGPSLVLDKSEQEWDDAGLYHPNFQLLLAKHQVFVL